MKIWTPAFAGVTALIVLSLAVSAQENVFKPTRETLNLKSSLERASKNNARLLEAAKELSIARAHSREAKSQFYPKANLNLSYVRYRNETLGLTMPELGATVLQPSFNNPATTEPNDENLYYSRVGFVQTLFAGGKLSTTYRLSKANVKRAESDYESLKRHVEYETTRGFYTLLALREKKERVQKTMADVDRLGKSAATMRKRLELRRQSSEIDREESSIRMDYLQLMGIELFNDVEIEGSLDALVIQPDLQQALAWAKQNRADLRQTELQAEVDQLSVNLSLAERYPVFLLGGSLEMRDREFPLEDNNWNTGVTMNIPLFDGFSSLSRIKASKYRAEQGRLRKVQLEDQIEREVRSAYNDVLYWQNEVGIRSGELDTVEKESRQGDRLAYLDWRLQAQLSLVEARQYLQLSRAALEMSVGRPLSE